MTTWPVLVCHDAGYALTTTTGSAALPTVTQ
ncbi:hypothetical protein EPYR_03970 [Erwinia pyrifoliae DSM 12163]|nr:hypothetical protein EPYR_03970 [Erwinia pyrifoliae DSM 12163]